VVTNKDFANVTGNARALLAMMAWMQYDPDGPWREKAEVIAHALSRIVLHNKKEGYAYYPDSGVGEAFSYPRSGWRHTKEPATENEGAEGSMFVYYGHPIRALSRWYRFTGDEEALDTARRLVKFVMKKRFWGVDGLVGDIDTAERGFFTGHMHGHTSLLYGLIEYAIAAGDSKLKYFVRESYEYARKHGIPKLGFTVFNQQVSEVCTVSDMIALAIKLTEAGVGDYYDDVDQMVRNHLAEGQLLNPDSLSRVTESAETQLPYSVESDLETADRVIERCIGIPLSMGVTGTDRPYTLCCCVGNGTQALYYAWSKIVEYESGIAKVNLLLNRSSPWMDIDSYLPYEGKVILHNKRAESVYIRISHWVERKQVQAFINDQPCSAHWVGPYLALTQINQGDTIKIVFPMSQETETYTHRDVEYTCEFKGNSVVQVSPNTRLLPAYSIYQRQYFRENSAPLKTSLRYSTPHHIRW
jgi:hypothetical protein